MNEVINNDKVLYLIRGLPGSGKSGLAASMSHNVVEADQYFVNEHTGEYKFIASKLGRAHEDCLNRTEHYLSSGCATIAVSNTFTTEAELYPYTCLAKMYGYRLVSIIVENRHGNSSIHNVPEDIINKMRNRFSVKLK